MASSLSENDFQRHKDCTPGDLVVAEDDESNVYEGTVVEAKGATVYVQSQSRGMLEFRRLRDGSDPVIIVGIDGREIVDEEITEGVNKDGIPMTKDSTTFSFDAQIVSFEREEGTQQIG